MQAACACTRQRSDIFGWLGTRPGPPPGVERAAMRSAEGPPAGDAYMACPVCFEVFTSSGSRRPRVLDCNHTFCSDCIRRWELMNNDGQGSPVSCPLCRQLTAELAPTPTSSHESLDNEMRVVWLGPEVGRCGVAGRRSLAACPVRSCRDLAGWLRLTSGSRTHGWMLTQGVAWVAETARGAGSGDGWLARMFKFVMCGGLLTIVGLVATVAVLAVRQNDQGGGHRGGEHHHSSGRFDLTVHTSLGGVRGHLVDYGAMGSARVFLGVP